MIFSLLQLAAQTPEGSLTLAQSILLATGTLLATIGGAWALLRGQVNDLREHKKGIDDRLKAVEERAIKTTSDVDHLRLAQSEMKQLVGQSEDRILAGVREYLDAFRREIEAILRGRRP